MANVIKLKRGSGSDPQASDLEVGELAIRTDLGKIFTKKDNGNVAEISGGGGVSDGDKGDITVSNSGDTFTIDNNVVSLAKLADINVNQIIGRASSGSGDPEALNPGQIRGILGIEAGATADQTAAEIKTLLDSNGIVNSNVDASAAIAGTKISPDFGSQNITTTGDIAAYGGDITISGTEAKLKFTDTNNNPDYILWNNGGVFRIYDNTNSSTRLKINTDGHVDVIGNLDVGAGLDVTGNITVSGTVDGRDLATDGSKLDGIASGATNVTNTNQLTNGAGFLTSVGTSNISNNAVTLAKMQQIGSPSFLGRNSSGTGNVENLSVSDVRTMLNVENGATADQSASEILTLIKTVDGSGSGLDADLLDGANASVSAGSNTIVKRHSAGYIFANYFNTTANDVSSGVTKVMVETGNDNYIRHGTAGAVRSFLNVEDGATADQSASEILTLIKTVDGAGSGLDADTLDGLSSGSFLRRDQHDATAPQRIEFTGCETNNQDTIATGTGNLGAIEIFNTGVGNDAFMAFHAGGDFAFYFGIDADINDLAVGGWSMGANKYRVWHAGNDGSGSGLDADTLDGAQPSVSAGNNTIVKRHSSGYIFANYFNTTPNDVSSGITKICVETSNDGYIRHGTAAAVRSFLNVEDGATAAAFPSGTRMIFQQTSAPTGWTKDTSDTNQRALRVVSGTASSGGSVDFTTAFASKGVSGSIANGGNNTNSGGNNTNNATAGGSVNNHTLNTGRMPQHRHIGGTRAIHDMVNGQYGTITQGQTRYPAAMYVGGTNGYANYDLHRTNYEGSSQTHNHGFSGSAHSHSINSHSHTINAHNHSFSGTAINLAVRYLDVIIAQKD